MKTTIRLFAACGAVALSGVVLVGQGGRQGGRAGPAAPGADEVGVSPAEIQRMFDGYALMQAQQQLNITDEQFARFLTRYKTLQDLRRQSLQQHTRVVNDLRRLLNTPPIEEPQIRERLKTLADLDTMSAADIQKALDAVDQVLDVQQQAKFRVFEENMERRKLDLVTRARQANRPKQ
ncbi:MAG: hypothetical protein HY047_19290 [Acidobacteria bacterium]|nr:hypothetical protein [Acidobacteriota bacterium]